MPGKTQDRIDQTQELINDDAAGINARLGKPFLKDFSLIPPRQGFGQMINQLLVETESFADISDGASGSVGDNGCGQGCSMAPIFFVDVLYDLFTTFVLEINIDVGRLVSFL